MPYRGRFLGRRNCVLLETRGGVILRGWEKTLVILVACIMAIPILFGVTAVDAKEEFSISIGHVLDAAHHYTDGANKFKELVEDRSGGRIKVEVFPNAQLGGEREMLEGLQLGTFEMAMVSSGPMGGFVPEFALLDLGFLFNDNAQAQEVLYGPVGDYLNQKMIEVGIRRLAYLDCGFRNVYGHKPVTKVDDLKGFKVRVMENPAHLELFKAIGANPLPMAWPELYTAMQQGVIDGAENVPDAYANAKHYEVAKYYSLTNHVYLTMMFLISENFYQRLPDDLKKIVADACVEASLFENQIIYKQQAEVFDFLRNNGVTITQIDDLSPFIQAGKKSWPVIAAGIPGGDELLNKILEATGKTLD